MTTTSASESLGVTTRTPSRPRGYTTRSRLAARTTSTPSRNTSSNGVLTRKLERSWWVISPVSVRMRRPASQRTGASTVILTCTRGRSTVSPICSNTKPRWKVSWLNKCLSGIPRSCVRAVAGGVTRTVLNADCMSAMRAVQWRTPT